ncbi:MAG: CpaD family pilus assembly lipoprotein [Holosporaceae bacterium]|jgi:type IV pilus biogenesis protein CpaD/CtpE|nr:CpaD family pilus assembly lipoprotein [Holosporaceae bacterium]
MKKTAIFTVICLLPAGCQKQYLADDGYVPETVSIDATETKNISFFPTSRDFSPDSATVEKMTQLLKDIHAEDIENIGFMLISDSAIPHEIQEKAKREISHLMGRMGFLNSRIVDSGTCIYKNAKVGIRIDALKYETNEINCDMWSEYIGDIDTNKHLPKYGAATAFNLLETIGNKADLISPRKYSGQETSAAIESAGVTVTGGGGGDSSSAASGSGGGSSGSGGK